MQVILWWRKDSLDVGVKWRYYNSMKKELTEKQKLFAQEYVRLGGKSHGTQAYRNIYDVLEGSASQTHGNAANELLNDERIKKLVEELSQDAFLSCGVDKKQLVDWLVGGVRTAQGQGKTRDMQACIAEINRMTGFHAPLRTENKNTDDIRVIEVELPKNGKKVKKETKK